MMKFPSSLFPFTGSFRSSYVFAGIRSFSNDIAGTPVDSENPSKIKLLLQRNKLKATKGNLTQSKIGKSYMKANDTKLIEVDDAKSIESCVEKINSCISEIGLNSSVVQLEVALTCLDAIMVGLIEKHYSIQSEQGIKLEDFEPLVAILKPILPVFTQLVFLFSLPKYDSNFEDNLDKYEGIQNLIVSLRLNLLSIFNFATELMDYNASLCSNITDCTSFDFILKKFMPEVIFLCDIVIKPVLTNKYSNTYNISSFSNCFASSVSRLENHCEQLLRACMLSFKRFVNLVHCFTLQPVLSLKAINFGAKDYNTILTCFGVYQGYENSQTQPVLLLNSYPRISRLGLTLKTGDSGSFIVSIVRNWMELCENIDLDESKQATLNVMFNHLLSVDLSKLSNCELIDCIICSLWLQNQRLVFGKKQNMNPYPILTEMPKRTLDFFEKCVNKVIKSELSKVSSGQILRFLRAFVSLDTRLLFSHCNFNFDLVQNCIDLGLSKLNSLLHVLSFKEFKNVNLVVLDMYEAYITKSNLNLISNSKFLTLSDVHSILLIMDSLQTFNVEVMQKCLQLLTYHSKGNDYFLDQNNLSIICDCISLLSQVNFTDDSDYLNKLSISKYPALIVQFDCLLTHIIKETKEWKSFLSKIIKPLIYSSYAEKLLDFNNNSNKGLNQDTKLELLHRYVNFFALSKESDNLPRELIIQHLNSLIKNYDFAVKDLKSLAVTLGFLNSKKFTRNDNDNRATKLHLKILALIKDIGSKDLHQCTVESEFQIGLYPVDIVIHPKTDSAAKGLIVEIDGRDHFYYLNQANSRKSRSFYNAHSGYRRKFFQSEGYMFLALNLDECSILLNDHVTAQSSDFKQLEEKYLQSLPEYEQKNFVPGEDLDAASFSTRITSLRNFLISSILQNINALFNE